MKTIKKYFLFTLSVCCYCLSIAQTPAFPGAEGHGMYTTGGRGGTVYYVTNLDDNSTAGSLRYAVTRSGARTILFKVSGTIVLNSELKINNGNVTIAGQSAPGDGICIAGFPVVVNADNVIVRYIRCRMGDEKDVSADGADALGGRRKKNIVIDHCSVSWSTDECCSFYENENFTMQWCLISESMNLSQHSKGEHGYGGIWGGMRASFHHNLMAHHKSRTPRLGPGENSTPTNELSDIRNNVYYNYNGEGCYGGEAMHANIVNNYYKPGPANTANATKKGRIIAIDKKIDNSYPKIENVWGTFYIAGNVVNGHANATNDNWTYGVFNQINSKYGTLSQLTKDSIRLTVPLETGIVTTHTAENAYEQVLLYAGCSYHRDALDARIIEETRTNTATFTGATANRPGIIDSQKDLCPAAAGNDCSAWPALNSETPLPDDNNDGIPDNWLASNHPGKLATNLNEEGYTYLEVYLNSLVSEITANQNAGGTTALYFPTKNNTGIKCYLDAFSHTLIINSRDTIKQTDILNMLGKTIRTSNPLKNNEQVNLSGVPSGVYIVRVLCEGYTSPYATKIKI